jgi:hypothetical protein
MSWRWVIYKGFEYLNEASSKRSEKVRFFRIFINFKCFMTSMIQVQEKPKYDLGTRVLAHVLPHPGHSSDAFLPGRITAHVGKMLPNDGRVPNEKPQHYYWVDLEEGGSVMQSEVRLIPDPRYKRK